MGTPHKHAKLIKAWADGAEIQSRITYGTWHDCIPEWSSHPDVEYRIKPKTIKYRNFLWRDIIFGELHVGVAVGQHAVEQKTFIKWLGDWQEVGV